MTSRHDSARPAPDKVLTDIADYVLGYDIQSPLAFETARHCLIDTLGCGLEALEYPACTKLLGPIVPGMSIQNGARVPVRLTIRWEEFKPISAAAPPAEGNGPTPASSPSR